MTQKYEKQRNFTNRNDHCSSNLSKNATTKPLKHFRIYKIRLKFKGLDVFR